MEKAAKMGLEFKTLIEVISLKEPKLEGFVRIKGAWDGHDLHAV